MLDAILQSRDVLRLVKTLSLLEEGPIRHGERGSFCPASVCATSGQPSNVYIHRRHIGPHDWTSSQNPNSDVDATPTVDYTARQLSHAKPP
jgi:hypothetical protein